LHLAVQHNNANFKIDAKGSCSYKLNISKNLVLFNGSVLNADIAFWMTTRQNLSQRFIGSSFRESVLQELPKRGWTTAHFLGASCMFAMLLSLKQ